MPRDKVALLINSCAKKPKPRRVTPSAPRPAQRSEHIDDALMATKRRRVAFGDVSIHVFPMAIADNPAVRSGVALGLGREEVCCIVKSVDEHQPLRPRFYPRRPVPWIHPERRREILAAEGITPEAIEASRKLVRAAQLERIKSLPPLYQLEKLPWFMARSLRRKLRRIGSKSRIGSSDNLAALAEPGPPGSDSLDGVKRKRGGLGSPAAQAAVADAEDDLARRVAQVELDAKAAEVAAPALATMDGSLHALPSKPAPGLDDMDGSLYNLRAFG